MAGCQEANLRTCYFLQLIILMQTANPNLLLIWTDEQRPDTLSCYGNTQTRTPNLDRLAQHSTVFEHCFCCSPVCTPSRGSILSGRWPHQHGALQNNIPLNEDCKTLAEYLGTGHRASYLGKWHLGDEIFAQHGWQDWISFEDEYIDHYSDGRDRSARSDYHHYLRKTGFPCDKEIESGPLYSRNYAASLGEPHTKAGWLGSRAAEAIRERSAEDGPWAMSVNFLEPHMPFFGPLNHRYDPDALEVPPVFNRIPEGPLPHSYFLHTEEHVKKGYDGQDVTTEAGWRRLMANYYGLVEMVDNAVGRILDALEESGQAENTIVVFTSDHGEMMGSHRMLGKGVFYRQSVEVPLLIHLPGQTESRRLAGNFSQIDLLPTLLDLMGVAVPSGLSGSSRADALRGGELPPEDIFLFWHPQKPGQPERLKGQSWRGIVTPDGWKYAVSPQEEIGLLFNLQDDPWEQRNRFCDPELASVRQTLHERLTAWMRKQDDPALQDGRFG